MRPPLRSAPHQVQTALPLVGFEVGPCDEPVPDHRPGRARSLAQAGRVDGHRAPLEQPKAQALDGIGDDSARTLVPSEQRRDRELPAEKAVRYLDQQACAIPALAVGVEAAAVREARQSLGAKGDRLMAEPGGGDKAHSTGCPGRRQVPRPGKT